MSSVAAFRRPSILTQQAKRSLQLWRTAKAQFEADRNAGHAEMTSFDLLPWQEREKYLAAAEGELATPPPIPIRDVSIGRDQVSPRERARGRLLSFRGFHGA